MLILAEAYLTEEEVLWINILALNLKQATDCSWLIAGVNVCAKVSAFTKMIGIKYSSPYIMKNTGYCKRPERPCPR